MDVQGALGVGMGGVALRAAWTLGLVRREHCKQRGSIAFVICSCKTEGQGGENMKLS